MREIKYRALAKDGTWRYGEYPHFAPEMSNTHYPMDVFWNSFLAAFRRETLGQWTGLLDKQGKEIYEGDIIRSGGDENFVDPVSWNDYYGEWWNNGISLHEVIDNGVEVIGNIWGNPELLKEKVNAGHDY